MVNIDSRLNRRHMVTGMVGAGLLVASGCGLQEAGKKILKIILDPSIPVGEPGDQPSEMNLSTHGMPGMNPNFDGKSTPVSIQIFALKSDHLLYETDLYTLIGFPKEALGVTLIEVLDEIQIEPGKFKVIRDYEIPAGTRNIGFAARFNTDEGTTWRASTPVTDKGVTENILVTVSGHQISVVKEDT